MSYSFSADVSYLPELVRPLLPTCWLVSIRECSFRLSRKGRGRCVWTPETPSLRNMPRPVFRLTLRIPSTLSSSYRLIVAKQKASRLFRRGVILSVLSLREKSVSATSRARPVQIPRNPQSSLFKTPAKDPQKAVVVPSHHRILAHTGFATFLVSLTPVLSSKNSLQLTGTI